MVCLEDKPVTCSICKEKTMDDNDIIDDEVICDECQEKKMEIVKITGTAPKGFIEELMDGYRFALKFDDDAENKYKLYERTCLFEEEEK